MKADKQNLTVSLPPAIRELIKTAAVKGNTTASSLVEQWAIENLKKKRSKKAKTSSPDCSINPNETQLTQ